MESVVLGYDTSQESSLELCCRGCWVWVEDVEGAGGRVSRCRYAGNCFIEWKLNMPLGSMVPS